MSLKKKYLKTKPVCQVTFALSKKEAYGAKSVHVVGDFNEWNQQATPMKKMKDGSFKIALDLAAGQEYQFRYVINNTQWENDPEADGFAPTPFGDCDNSVIRL